MSGYEMYSFCKECGGCRRRMPFGEANSFFDTGPCHECGADGGSRKFKTAKRMSEPVGIFKRRTFYVDRDGNELNLAANPNQSHEEK